MLTLKRVVISTLSGVLFGFVCMGLASSNPDASQTLPPSALVMIVISRTFTGFTIGISAIRMRWWLHGTFLGIITSIPMAVPVSDNMPIFIGTFVMGMIYGFLIELLTSVVFRAKSPAFLKAE